MRYSFPFGLKSHSHAGGYAIGIINEAKRPILENPTQVSGGCSNMIPLFGM
jgi:hypothetical protein